MVTDNEWFYTSSSQIIERQEEIIYCQSPKEGKEKNGKKKKLKIEKRRKKVAHRRTMFDYRRLF